MGYITEPKYIDLLVAPAVLTDEAKHAISDAIAQYRKTGQIPTSTGNVNQTAVQFMPNKVVKHKNARNTVKK
jgi:hypothetical protein